MKRYTSSHEWISFEGEVGTVGISSYAQKELGEIVFVEMPEEGKKLLAGKEAAILESTKAAADVYTPVSGEVIKSNALLKEKPQLLNESPEEDGWLFKIKLSNKEELEALLSEEEYLKMVLS